MLLGTAHAVTVGGTNGREMSRERFGCAGSLALKVHTRSHLIFSKLFVNRLVNHSAAIIDEFVFLQDVNSIVIMEERP